MRLKAGKPGLDRVRQLAGWRQLVFNCLLNTHCGTLKVYVDANFDTAPAAISPARVDWTVLLAVACLVCSWFFMTSLITDLGFMQLTFRFYNVLTLIHSPGRIAIGTFGPGATRDAWLFGTVCVLAVLAPLAPLVCLRKDAWLGCVAPFALMALCGAIMYHGLSQDLIPDDGALGETGSRVIHFANNLAGQVGTVITRRIHVGVGGYLAIAASVVLAVKGLRGYHEAL
jgi:hypothetical protein